MKSASILLACISALDQWVFCGIAAGGSDSERPGRAKEMCLLRERGRESQTERGSVSVGSHSGQFQVIFYSLCRCWPLKEYKSVFLPFLVDACWSSSENVST